MRFAAAVFCLLAGSLLYAQETLPGQDLIGSDRSLHRGDAGNQIVTSPDANTQIGGYAGNTSGVVTVPGIQTTGTDSRTNLQNASEAGQSREAGAMASRHPAAEIAAQHGRRWRRQWVCLERKRCSKEQHRGGDWGRVTKASRRRIEAISLR